jgi:hypothetical protein
MVIKTNTQCDVNCVRLVSNLVEPKILISAPLFIKFWVRSRLGLHNTAGPVRCFCGHLINAVLSCHASLKGTWYLGLEMNFDYYV